MSTCLGLSLWTSAKVGPNQASPVGFLGILFDVFDHPKHLNCKSCLGNLFDAISVPIWYRCLSYVELNVGSTLGSLAGLWGSHVHVL